MAFFDDFGKKISNLGQSAVQKTKGVTYAAGLNSMINDEERNLNNNYREIGRIYVKLHSNDPEPSLADYVRAAVQSENKLAAYHKQAQEARGMVRCPACGNHVTANSSFCNNCGFKLPPQQMNVNPTKPQGNGMPVPPMNPQGNGMPVPPMNPQGNGMPVPPMNPQGNGMPVPPMNPQGNGIPMPSMNPQGNGIPMPPMKPQGNGIPMPSMNPQGNGMPTPSMNPQNSSTVSCSNCGAAMDGSLNFCTRCGTKLNKDVHTPNVSENKSPFARKDTPDVKSENTAVDENITPSDIIREKADISEDNKSDNIKCVNCGSVIAPELDLCTVCGAKQEKVSASKPKLSLEKKRGKSEKTSEKQKIENFSETQDNSEDNSTVTNDTPENKQPQEKPLESSPVPTVPDENPNDENTVTTKEFSDNKPEETAIDEIKCPKCGAALNPNLNFCIMCGTKLKSSADEKPPIISVSTVPQDSSENKQPQEKPSESSPVPTVPPILSENPKEEPPKKPKGLFIKKSKPPKKKEEFLISSVPPMPQGQPLDKPSVPPMPQEQPFDKPPMPPISQGQPSDKLPEPVKNDDKPNQISDNFKTTFALSETALEFLNKKPELPEFDVKPETNDVHKDEVKCPSCGGYVKRNVKFCVLCGEKMSAEDNTPQAAENSLNKPEENKPLGNREIKCSNCGSLMSKGMKFCTLCGAMLSDDLSTPSTSDNSSASERDSGTGYGEYFDFSEEDERPEFMSENVFSDDDFGSPLYSMPTVVLPRGPFDDDEPDSAPTINLDGQMCPNCKSVMASDVLFCTECGTRL